MTDSTWILGAPDPEMAAVETLLVECGQRVVYAARDGRRVRGGDAYRADGVIAPDGQAAACLDDEVMLVECGGPVLDGLAAGRCDHHRPGDPGYGRPPEEYLPAASLGQVSARLGVDLDHEQRLVAAADHCLGAAYAGQCPGVDPDELGRYRARQRADWLRSLPPDRPEVVAVRAPGVWPVECVECGALAPDPGNYALACGCCGHEDWGREADAGRRSAWVMAVRTIYDETAAALRALPRIALGGVEVIDVRGQVLPELPEVLARTGQVALYRRPIPGRRDKLGILGAGLGTVAGPEPVEAFLASARQGEVCGMAVDPESVYGDPARGFAGAEVTA